MKKVLSLALALVLCLGLTVSVNAYDMGRVGQPTLVSAGGDHTAAIDLTGALWTWGNNSSGELGNGSNLSSNVPVKVLEDVVSVSCGSGHTAALKADGTLWTWGSNSYGQLGNGSTDKSNKPVKVLSDVAAVSCGGYHTAAIKTDGTLWMWGYNNCGQLGNGSTANSIVPIKVLDNVSAVSCGWLHTAALKSHGTLWAWGTGYNGQLGNGRSGGMLSSDTMSSTPVKIMDNVKAISCGMDHTAAIKTDGTLWTWGSNEYSQLGKGNSDISADNNTPAQVMENAVSLSCGYTHTAAVDANGILWTWGNNSYGQLGNGSTTNSDRPVAVANGVEAVSCGGAHTVAFKTDHSLWIWGENRFGQLGDGGNRNSYAPERVEAPAFAPPFDIQSETLVKYNGPGGDVVIPDGVTDIGGEAFKGCTNLRSVVIPSGVVEIGPSAFEDCTNLTSVTIPDSVSIIGADAFKGTPWVKNQGEFAVVNGILVAYNGSGGDAYIPSGVTQIAPYALEGYKTITSVGIPASVSLVGGYAFANCDSLERVTFAGKDTMIGENAFYTIYDPADMSGLPISGLTIYAPVGGEVQAYCQEQNIPFSAEAKIAYASTQTVQVDGRPVKFQAYALRDASGDTNYIKLRDVACVLNGTAAQFEVGWDGAVNIQPGTPYSVTGTEMSTPFSGNRPYELASAQTKINGVPAPLSAIVLQDDDGGSYTYYKLRDLGSALGFIVGWSQETGITITTK